MRTAPTQDLNIAVSDGQATWIRVLVADGDGADVTVTSLYGDDFEDSVELSESIDEPIQTCTLMLRRELFYASLAPLVASSRVNIDAGTGSKQFALGRSIKVDAQIRPSGAAAGSTWHRIFQGFIEAVDPGSGDYQMKVEARDLGSRLQRRWIEDERIYGVWQPGRRYLAGTVVSPTTDDPNDSLGTTRWMIANNTGTSHASTEPTWPARGSGSTVVDNSSITWQEQTTYKGTPLETAIQQLLDDNLGASVVTLNTPSSPGYYVRDWNQQQENVLSACKALADLIGWDLRYTWDGSESGGSFKLTLQAPERTSPSVAYTIGPDKYRTVSQFSQNITAIRNKVRVKYYNRASLDSTGNPTPASYTASDSTSITAYGTQFMEIAEAASSQIDTSAEAQTLAEAVLADLKDPLLNVTLSTEFLWWLQLNDYVTVSANMLHSDGDQSVALYSIRHSLKQGGMATSEFGLRGKPCSGHFRWHSLAATPGNAPANRLLGPRAPRAIATAEAVGGLSVAFQPPIDPRLNFEHAELYLSTSNGFTPSSSNRIATSKNGRFDVQGLTPATTYYGKIAHRDRKGNLGPMSAQFSQATGRASLAHLVPEIRQQVAAYSTSNHTFTANGSDALLVLDSSLFDMSTPLFDAGTSSVTFAVAGYYRVFAIAKLTGVSAGDAARLVIKVNGTIRYGGPIAEPVTFISGGSNTGIDCVVEASFQIFNPADVLTVAVQYYPASGTPTITQVDSDCRLECTQILL